VGTHEILIGSVDEIVIGPRAERLVYVDRTYKSIS
jgi:flavin reductase (DIM6/NTAB) family NADH-FMN oxidoreductase RutF